MNSNVKKRDSILTGYTGKPPDPIASFIAEEAPPPPPNRPPGSKVISINRERRADIRPRKTVTPAFQIEKEEIQEAMDCLLRLKAIIALRESDLADH